MTDNHLSACHNAPVKVVGGVGDFSDRDRAVTMHYVCTECGEACDIREALTDTNKALDVILYRYAVHVARGKQYGIDKNDIKAALLKWRDEAVVAELENLTELPNIQVPAGMHVQAVYTSVIKARIKQLEAE